ncbi:MAG: hypothetical protein Q8N14_01595, partial [Candidatus Omnitrophota bacterium]|nr:hypothetical protein [Candidatus Omnitrophota bacterium]
TKYLKLSVQQKVVPLVPTSLVEYWHSNLNFSDIKEYNKLVSTKNGRLKLKANIFANTATKNKNPAGS